MSVTAGIPCGHSSPACGGRCQRCDARPHPMAPYRCQILSTHAGPVSPHSARRHGQRGVFFCVCLHLTRMSAGGVELSGPSRFVCVCCSYQNPGPHPPLLGSGADLRNKRTTHTNTHKFQAPNFPSELPRAPHHLWWEKAGNLPTEAKRAITS